MKKYIFGILAVAMAVGFSAFTTKSAHKPFTTYKVFDYKAGTANQLIVDGVTDPFEPRESSLDATNFQSASNWNIAPASNGVAATTGGYLNKLFIDDTKYESTSDGGADGQVSLSEILTSMWGYYSTQSSPKTLPANGSSVTRTINGVSYQIFVNRAGSIF